MSWFVAFLFFLVAYYGFTAYLIGVLKSQHPETYESLERPLPFWNDHRTPQLMLWLLLGEYRALPDNTRKLPFTAARAIAFGVIATFAGFLVSIVSG